MWPFAFGLGAVGLFAVLRGRRSKPKTDGGGSSSPSDDSNSNGNSSQPSGGGSSPRSPTPPPNVSGDRAGYNSRMFGSPAAVRSAFETLGYSTPNANNMAASTRSFQGDWNAISRAFAAGTLTLPEAPAVGPLIRGELDVDGVPGKYTLRALEIALMIKQSGGRWYPLVTQAHALARAQ